ncbi:hypothetical protein FS837_002128 [Tulasnella sp. UAMH 9824]|nr:hypothetical protein FS837_002128 [Tulasnella sp. UAMH 9824]
MTTPCYRDSFPTHNSPAQLADLTPVKLIELHVDSKDQRGLILSAIKKAGYVAPPGSKKGSKRKAGNDDDDDQATASSSSKSKTSTKTSAPSKRPRRKEPSPEFPDSSPPDGRESIVPGGFNFDEVLDEEVCNPPHSRKVFHPAGRFTARHRGLTSLFYFPLSENFAKTLKSKSTQSNRAPVMTAWATVVAERMGFKREEALSIASVYTEMNAASKGVSIGIYAPSKNDEYASGSTQPFVELMGRKPVLERDNGQWRGIIKGSPVDPASSDTKSKSLLVRYLIHYQPFGYIQRCFRQTTPAVMGAMRLLAHAYSAKELNEIGYSLYCDFRPESTGWGKKAEMKMETILALRKRNNNGGSGSGSSSSDNSTTVVSKTEEAGEASAGGGGSAMGSSDAKSS